MFATLFTFTLFITLAIQAVFAEFSITNPSLTQCQDAKITWQATSGPYSVIVVPSNDECGNPLADLGDHSGTSMTWNKVPLMAGTSVVVEVTDNNGDEAWSGAITVLPSEDTSCLPKNLQASASAADASALGVATTLVVPPSTTSGAKAAGAANAGLNPLHSGALSVSQISVPTLGIGALIGVFSLFL